MSRLDPNMALAQRYEMLVEKWLTFGKHTNARLCRWHIEQDELQMIEQFVDAESGYQGRTPELFFKLTTPFLVADDFGYQLIEELVLQLRNYQELSPNSGFELNWHPSTPEQEPEGHQYFLRNFAAFAASLDFDDAFVAYLCPSEIDSITSWVLWLEKLMETNISDSIRIMFVDIKNGQTEAFEKSQEKYPDLMYSICPELDMTGAMKEVASAGDPNHPGVQFQLAFIDLSEAAGKGQVKRIEELGKKCMNIARQEDWPHLQVAVFFTMGATLMGKQSYDKALDAYDQASRIAENMYQTQREAGAQLFIQALFARASLYFSTDEKIRDLDRAYSDYKKAIEVVDQLPEDDPARPYHGMEAWRMMGTCKEELKDYHEAQRCYQNALTQGSIMPVELRRQSTLSYTGAALVRINPRIGNYEQEMNIRNRMNELIGEDWENKVLTKKSVA